MLKHIYKCIVFCSLISLSNNVFGQAFLGESFDRIKSYHEKDKSDYSIEKTEDGKAVISSRLWGEGKKEVINLTIYIFNKNKICERIDEMSPIGISTKMKLHAMNSEYAPTNYIFEDLPVFKYVNDPKQTRYVAYHYEDTNGDGYSDAIIFCYFLNTTEFKTK